MNQSPHFIPNEIADQWQEPFDALLDEIFWEGYSEQLVEDSPETYQREFVYFISLYDEPLPI